MTAKLLNQFDSNKSKATIWNLMIENKLFEGIDNVYSNDVKTHFEKKISDIATKITPIDTLVILNKQVIADMMTYNLKYKELTKNKATTPPIVTAAEITEQRQQQFNKVLESKKNEFNSLIKNTVPDKVNFSDNPDKPIGSEMDKILAETIAWREKQLNIVLQSQDKKEASEWIKSTATNEIPPSKVIKIGPSTMLDTKNIVDLPTNTIEKSEGVKQNKHVSFSIENKEDDDSFLTMLKQKSDIYKNENQNQNQNQDSNNEIKSLLKEILNNQKTILSLLAKN